jgi:hypothetical protein
MKALCDWIDAVPLNTVEVVMILCVILIVFSYPWENR